MNAKLFLGGISQDSTEQTLRAHFAQFGPLNDLCIMMDSQTGNSRGFGFVTFESIKDAAACCAQGRMQHIDGKKVEVKPAEAKGKLPPPVDRNRRSGDPWCRRGTTVWRLLACTAHV